jgi:hypothetical protein
VSPQLRNPSPNKFLWVMRLSILWKVAALFLLLWFLVHFGVI